MKKQISCLNQRIKLGKISYKKGLNIETFIYNNVNFKVELKSICFKYDFWSKSIKIDIRKIIIIKKEFNQQNKKKKFNKFKAGFFKFFLFLIDFIFFKFIVKIISNFNFNVLDLSLNLHDESLILFTNFKILFNFFLDQNNLFVFVLNINFQKLTHFFEQIKNFDNENNLVKILNLNFEIKLNIDMVIKSFDSFSYNIEIDNFVISALCIALMNLYKKNKNNSTHTQNEYSQSFFSFLQDKLHDNIIKNFYKNNFNLKKNIFSGQYENDFKKIMIFHNLLHLTLSHFQIKIVNFKIIDLPFLLKSHNETLINHYMTKKNIFSLILSIKNIDILYDKVYSMNFEFTTFFDSKNDLPSQFFLNLGHFTLETKNKNNDKNIILTTNEFKCKFKSNLSDFLQRKSFFFQPYFNLNVTFKLFLFYLDLNSFEDYIYNFIIFKKMLNMKDNDITNLDFSNKNEVSKFSEKKNSNKTEISLFKVLWLKCLSEVSNKNLLFLFNFCVYNLKIVFLFKTNDEILNNCQLFFSDFNINLTNKDNHHDLLGQLKINYFDLSFSLNPHLSVNQNKLEYKPIINFKNFILYFNALQQNPNTYDFTIHEVNFYFNELAFFIFIQNFCFVLNKIVINDLKLLFDQTKNSETKLSFFECEKSNVVLRIKFFKTLFLSKSFLLQNELLNLNKKNLTGFMDLKSKSEIISIQLNEFFFLSATGTNFLNKEETKDDLIIKNFLNFLSPNKKLNVLLYAKIKDLFIHSDNDIFDKKKNNSSRILKFINLNFLFTKSLHDKKNFIELHTDEIIIVFDRIKLFTIFGTIFLIQNFFRSYISTLNFLKNFKTKKSEPLNLILKYDCVKFHLNFFFSNNQAVKFEIVKFLLKIKSNSITLKNEFLRILTISLLVSNYWSRLVCIDSLMIDFKTLESNPQVLISSKLLKIIHPYKFIGHKLISEISVHFLFLKYIYKVFNSQIVNNEKIISKETKPIILQNIEIRTNSLFYIMDDNPFESELNYIFQLGLTEQKKRIELFTLFQKKSKPMDLNYSEELYNLNLSFSRSWIRKVRVYNSRLKKLVYNNKNFLFGNENNYIKFFDKRTVSYTHHAPLLLMIMETVHVNIDKPKFDIKDLPQFLYKIGQNLPTSTRFSLLAPFFINLKSSGVRIHIRDYPLPLLYILGNKISTLPSILISGTLVIAEELWVDPEQLKVIFFSLTKKKLNNKEEKDYFSLNIYKSLTSVKLYGDISCEFISKLPPRFVWCLSKTFALLQFLSNFDNLNKSLVQPSMTLSFWDKIRYVLHGRFQIKTQILEIGILSSRNSYTLSTNQNGFVLSFKDNVIWKINENDDPLNFFRINSDKLIFYIPNYCKSSLISWINDSSQSVQLSKINSFITDFFFYYFFLKKEIDSTNIKSNLIEKVVLNLSGGVNFVLGFFLEREDENKVKVSTFKPHYDVKLFNTQNNIYINDTFSGFRSQFMHMKIFLNVNKEKSYNSIHFTPTVFKHFFNWWKIFNGNMILPVSKGPLFGESKISPKFSHCLSTNVFRFNFKSLYVSHLYNVDFFDHNKDVELIGLKARVNNFVVDLHQRKEPRIHLNESLSINEKTMKMNLFLGSINFSDLDLRVIHAVFKHDDDNLRNNFFEGFDDDKTWFNIDDYNDAFNFDLNKSRRKIFIYPFIYCKDFFYIRNTNTDSVYQNKSDILGYEDNQENLVDFDKIHDLKLKTLDDRIAVLNEIKNKNKTQGINSVDIDKRIEFLLTEKKNDMALRDNSYLESDFYHNCGNKFILINMLLKWNVKVRNLMFKYIHFVQLQSCFEKYLFYESFRFLDDLIKRNNKLSCDSLKINKPNSYFLNQRKNSGIKSSVSETKFKTFDEAIRIVSDNEDYRDDYSIEIISPQIQLQIDENQKSVVFFVAPKILCNIISIFEKSNLLVLNMKDLEKRFGFLLENSNIIVFEKETLMKSNKLFLSEMSYGSKTDWPPWLGVEICKNGLWAGIDNLLVEKTSIMLNYNLLLYNKESNNSNSDYLTDRLNIEIPNINISFTPKQYLSLYMIIVDLFFYIEPISKSLTEKLEKLRFSINFRDLNSVNEKLIILYKKYKLINFLLLNYCFRYETLEDNLLKNFNFLIYKKKDLTTKIYLIIRSLFMDPLQKKISTLPKTKISIKTNEIILHVLEDNSKPILDLILTQTTYERIINNDGSNKNQFKLGVIKGFNLISSSRYSEIVEPLISPDFVKDDSNELIIINWTMNRSVGGIKIIENLEIFSKPLVIKLDEITGEKFTNFFFNLDSQKNTNVDDTTSIQINNNNVTNIEDLTSLKLKKKNEKSLEFMKNLEVNHLDSLIEEMFDEDHKSFSNFLENNYHNEVKQMIERSKKYMSIAYLKINSTSILISLSLSKGYKRLLNVEDLLLNLNEIVIKNKIMSLFEITQHLQKKIFKLLLSYTGRVIKNKLTIKSKHEKNDKNDKNDKN